MPANHASNGACARWRAPTLARVPLCSGCPRFYPHGRELSHAGVAMLIKSDFWCHVAVVQSRTSGRARPNRSLCQATPMADSSFPHFGQDRRLGRLPRQLPLHLSGFGAAAIPTFSLGGFRCLPCFCSRAPAHNLKLRSVTSIVYACGLVLRGPSCAYPQIICSSGYKALSTFPSPPWLTPPQPPWR